MRTVAVDFDGVIHAYTRGWQDGTIYDAPVDGAFDALRTLMDRYAVFVHTTRDAAQVASWITERSGLLATVEGVQVDDPIEFWNTQGVLLVTARKLPAIAYIDDRAIRFDNWTQALADLGRQA